MNDKKVARLCWNSHNWQKPSGMLGKVKNLKSYEQDTGYGHEEWLFDIGKMVDGHHYGYIQAIGQHHNKYLGQVYDISFYTIDSRTKQRWWLGEILNVKIVDGEESRKVYEVYKKKGWLREMYSQLDAVQAKTYRFKKIKPRDFCCVKFTLEDMRLLDEPLSFFSHDPAIKSDYYNLKNKILSPQVKSNFDFAFASGGASGKRSTTAVYGEKSREIDLVHNQIQECVQQLFNENHGEENVAIENPTGFGTKIDLVVKDGKSLIFYEIKTANTAKQCIREALSQLLEYSCFIDRNLASKLVVLSPAKLTVETKKYLENVRSRFSIPLYYQSINLEAKTLSDEV